MPLPVTFATLPTGNNPASLLDTEFLAVANMGTTYCTATGTNTILLTPGPNQPNPTGYANGQQFSFLAPANNTGPVTIQVGSLAALPLRAGGQPLAAGALTAGTSCDVMVSGNGTTVDLVGGGGGLSLSGGTVTGPVTFNSTVSGGGLLNDVGRNKLHNAMFRIQQRGTGPWTTTASYTADRWVIQIILDTVSASLGSMTDTARAAIGDEEANTYLGINVTGNAGATAFTQLVQRTEDVRRLAGKTVTVSFYCQGSTTLNLGVLLSQNFGTGGSPSTGVNLPPQTVPISTAWKRYSVTFTVPSVSGKTLGTNNDHSTSVNFAFSSGANNSATLGVGVQSGSWSFWGMQLEIGSVMTPLEKIDIAVDWAECWRFYFAGSVQFNGYGGAGGNFAVDFPYPVRMRGTPVMTSNFTTQSNCSGSAVAAAGAQCYQHAGSVTALGQFASVGTFTASADL